MIRIEVFSRVRTGRLTANTVRRIVRAVCRREHRNAVDLSVVFVGDDRMTGLNRRYLRHDRTTDVITFPLGNNPIAAEVYINSAQARRQAARYGVSRRNELTRLVVHGTLHALGYTDKRRTDREAMIRRQERYVSELSSK